MRSLSPLAEFARLWLQARSQPHKRAAAVPMGQGRIKRPVARSVDFGRRLLRFSQQRLCPSQATADEVLVPAQGAAQASAYFLGRLSQLANMKTQTTKNMMIRMSKISM